MTAIERPTGKRLGGRYRSMEDMPLWNDVERLIEDAWPHGWPRRLGWPSWGELTRVLESLGPRVDVIDRTDDVLLRAEVPGIEKNDLDLEVTPGSVKIRGRLHTEEKEDEGDYYRREISQQAFTRTIHLPTEIDPEQVKATFRNGILEIKMPKVSKGKRCAVTIDE